jgi:hypothetical protein
MKEVSLMNASPEERLQEIWAKLLAREQEEMLDFAEFLARRQGTSPTPEERLSEEEHAHLVAALEAVAALSQETGPAVSNRTHDIDLYGKC